MSDPDSPTPTTGSTTERSSVDTGRTTDFEVQSITMLILEMEDVLFHLNSAVMMPANPEGVSSEDGSEDDATDTEDTEIQARQEAMTGIGALSLVFRQFELDPQKRILIAGHTDTSGGVRMNFELSEQRAQNVLYLLNGDRDAWSTASASRHNVEDYQQILTFFCIKNGWNCDPLGVDDAWGDNTETATQNFFNQLASDSVITAQEAQEIFNAIRGHGRKKWPERAWQLVYDLYIQVLCETMGKTLAELNTLRTSLLRFAYSDQEYIACGESFPIDDAEKENYRSQRNRRVEILFFDEGEAPELTCPEITTRTHTSEECPLRNIYRIHSAYLDPNDLHAIPYHLKFVYYNRIKKQQMDIPQNLTIRAFKQDETLIPTRINYSSGVYTVIVQFPTQDEADNNKDTIYFSFENTSPDASKWIRTENDSATPEIVDLTNTEWDALTSLQRWNYYDLPQTWNARNWRCMVGSTANDFSGHISSRTSQSSPIIFNLDDIVLTKDDGSQIITDFDANYDTSNPNGHPHPLSNRSRVRILFINPQNNKIDYYKTNTSGSPQQQHDSSIIQFQTNSGSNIINFIKDPPGGARAVVFCSQFYDVTSRRTTQTTDFSFTNGHILGARAAQVNDADVHKSHYFPHNDSTRIVHSPGVGDFELHYLHNGGFDDTRIYSHLVIYWNTIILKDTKPTVGSTNADRTPATDAQVNEFKSIGLINSMDHWNKKEYQFEDNAGTDTHIIRPFFFFEANETFSYTAPTPAVDFEDKINSTASKYTAVISRGDFITALGNARGGTVKTISFIVEEKKGSWVLSARRSDRKFSLMSLRIKTRSDDNSRFSGFPVTDFGQQFGCLVIAHEIGHATGQVDDYMQTTRAPWPTHVSTYAQFGRTTNGDRIATNNSNFSNRATGSDAFHIRYDRTSLMVRNGPIRLRHVWRFVHWINTKGQSGEDLHSFINGTRFKINFSRGSLSYYRTSADKFNPWAFSVSATLNATANRPMNVYLFRKLDETRRAQRSSGTNVDFRAILVVRPLWSITFVDGSSATWNDARKQSWTNSFWRYFNPNGSTANLLFEGKFLLAGGGGDLDPTVIRVIPGFDFYSGSAPAHTTFNFRIEVVRGSNSAPAQTGNVLRVGHRYSTRSLVNYFFNKAASATTFAPADFTFVRTWFRLPTIGNGTFNVERM